MNLYLLITVFLCTRECNTRVVPLNFKQDESKHMVSRTTENEMIDESPPEEIEKLGHNLPDIKESNDLDFLNSEDKNTSGLVISNRNASDMSVDLSSKEKDIREESKLRYAESSVEYDLPEEFNLTSQLIGKKDSDSKEPLGNLKVNGSLNEESTDNLIVKIETLISNNSSNLEKEISIEFEESEEKILNDTVGAIFTVFNGSNSTEDSHQLHPISDDTVEIFLNNTGNITHYPNESSAILEVLNVTNNADNSLQLQPLSNGTEVEVFLADAENDTNELKLKNLATENLEMTKDSTENAGVILSGFEFLINSEVGRNAAKAMEIFNFSDPLTDHIMEENEFHSFLPEFNGEQISDAENQTDLKTEISITNSLKESNETQADLNTTLPTGEKTLVVLNQSENLENKNNSMPINLNEHLGERNETESLNFTELKGNASSEISSHLKNPEKTDHLASEVTTSKEDINGSVSNSSAVGVPKCPLPGWCVFGFLSQDTCAVNEHCLGNRICCKIGCSKTCIEV